MTRANSPHFENVRDCGACRIRTRAPSRARVVLFVECDSPPGDTAPRSPLNPHACGGRRCPGASSRPDVPQVDVLLGEGGLHVRLDARRADLCVPRVPARLVLVRALHDAHSVPAQVALLQQGAASTTTSHPPAAQRRRRRDRSIHRSRHKHGRRRALPTSGEGALSRAISIERREIAPRKQGARSSRAGRDRAGKWRRASERIARASRRPSPKRAPRRIHVRTTDQHPCPTTDQHHERPPCDSSSMCVCLSSSACSSPSTSARCPS